MSDYVPRPNLRDTRVAPEGWYSDDDEFHDIRPPKKKTKLAKGKGKATRVHCISEQELDDFQFTNHQRTQNTQRSRRFATTTSGKNSATSGIPIS